MLKKVIFSITMWLGSSSLVLAESDTKMGLPQFNSSTYPSQIFWLLLIFALLYIFLYFVVIPKIKQIKHSREHFIDENEFHSAKINKELNKLNELYENKLTASYDKSKAYLLSVQKTLHEHEEKHLLELKIKNNLLKEETLKNIALENEQFFKNLPKNLHKIVTTIMRTLNVPVSEETIKSYIANNLDKGKENV